MLTRSAALLLLLLAGVHGLRPAPTARPTIRTRSAAPLLAAEPVSADSTAGNIAAGAYIGVATVIDAAAFTSIVFGPVGLPLTIGLQHALVGFVVMQTVVTRLTGAGFALAPTSYEVMPFLAKFAAVAAAAGVGGASLLATVLAGSLVVGLLGAALVALSAEAPVDDVEKLLPPALQAGLFAAIGWSIFLLAFDSLGLSFSLSPGMLAWASARLWLPANVLGIGLWFVSRRVDSPFLFPGFIGLTTAVVHAVRALTGTSVAGARAAGWLMAEAAGAPATQLYTSLSPALVRWDVLFSSAAFPLLVSAALFGPVVNTVLNYLLFGPLFKTKLNVKRELRAHAAGAGLAAAGGGYSSYVALSNTAIHKKWAARRSSRPTSRRRSARSSSSPTRCAPSSATCPPSSSPRSASTSAPTFCTTTSPSRSRPRWVRAAAAGLGRALRAVRRELGGPPPLREEGHAPRHGGGRARLSGRRAAQEIKVYLAWEVNA